MLPQHCPSAPSPGTPQVEVVKVEDTDVSKLNSQPHLGAVTDTHGHITGPSISVWSPTPHVQAFSFSLFLHHYMAGDQW